MPKQREIRYIYIQATKRKEKQTWVFCPHCGKKRWIDFYKAQKGNYEVPCRSCSNRIKMIPYAFDKSPLWKGGRNVTSYGYINIRLRRDDFFYSMASDGYVLEHRLVVAKALGRCLHSWEIVHHKNGIRDDNRIENLQLVTDDRHKQISILENKIKKLEAVIVELRANAH